MLDRSNTTDRPDRRTSLIAKELSKYKIDIAALSESKLADEGCITEDLGGYTFFWKGYPHGESRIHGVAFAIRNVLLRFLSENPVGISPSLMKLTIPPSDRRYATLFSCYFPTLVASEEHKGEFCSTLDREIHAVISADKLIILGDFNARVGREYLGWSSVIGQHGLDSMNSKGHRLLTLCAQNELLIIKTIFQP